MPATPTRIAWRTALMALAVALFGLTLSVAPAGAAKPRQSLPTPTSIVVSDVGQRHIDLKIGGTTTQNYDIFVNGDIRAVNAPSSSTIAWRIPYLQPGTTYSIQVQQRVDLRLSPLSAPIIVRTLPGPVVAPITNLRVVSTTSSGTGNTITLAWDASATPGAAYDITLNGQSNQGTYRTTTVVGESLNCYPGPCVGTGPKNGPNTISIVAGAFLDGFFIQSTPVTITVNV